MNGTILVPMMRGAWRGYCERADVLRILRTSADIETAARRIGVSIRSLRSWMSRQGWKEDEIGVDYAPQTGTARQRIRERVGA